ncbi:RibD family protein [Pseudonocardia acaciae]|uniref:RibD family protein n=1 Tax=Pseudonocardia acaciae TaxID=551276 RepID=UPI00049123C0|nr:dihydrofolate reductase family protein [Pseudonocardia acaciae]
MSQPRPYVLLSAAVSMDGFLDDTGPTPLVLSSPADFDEIDQIRAGVDAILVGAGTVRADNPRLLVRSESRRRERERRGLPASPAKVTLSTTGELDPDAAFFTAGDVERLVYVPDAAVAATKARVGAVATVIGAGEPLALASVLADLHARGCGRLLVEGGGLVHTLFLTEDAVDEVRLAVAPFFVGDAAAPRWVSPAAFPDRRLRLAEARALGDIAVLRYLAR